MPDRTAHLGLNGPAPDGNLREKSGRVIKGLVASGLAAADRKWWISCSAGSMQPCEARHSEAGEDGPSAMALG